MTYDRRTDPPDPAHDTTHDPNHDDTRVVERETYVERPVERSYTPPPATDGGQVNVNAQGQPVYAERAAPGPLYYARRVLSLLFGILAVLLGLRILLLLLVANQTNPIVDFVYGVTEPFVAPFRGIFAINEVTPGGGSVLDVAAIVALIGWMLIYLLLMAILRLGDRDRV